MNNQKLFTEIAKAMKRLEARIIALEKIVEELRRQSEREDDGRITRT